MRNSIAVLLALAACGKAPMPDDVGSIDAGPPAEPPAFKIVSPDIQMMPGQETIYCYYFHTPNTATVPVKKWVSDLTAGSHHMILFFSNSAIQPDGTLNTCEGGNGAEVPIWTYLTQTLHQEIDMPSDDGTGLPLAQEIPAGQPAFFQMHYLNTTDSPLTVHVELDAFAYDAGVTYTKTASYVTYNTSIDIPPGAVNHLESRTCDVPAGIKFWEMTTHSHKQSAFTDVKDGDASSTMVLQSNDWQHPTVQLWNGPEFYTFASGSLTYECTYDNIYDNAANTIVTGPSAQTNEMCMAVGYYFPATVPHMCLNEALVQ